MYEGATCALDNGGYHKAWSPKTETARFLCRDEHTAGGALVLVKRNGQNVIVRSRLPAIIPAEQKTWRTHTTPLGDMVWVSNRGDVQGADALRDIGQDLGLVTYEESTFPVPGDRCFTGENLEAERFRGACGDVPSTIV